MSILIFRRLRFFRWLLTAYVKKHALFLILGIAFGVLFGLNFKFILPFIYKNEKVQRIGIIGNYSSKNLPLEIQRLLSVGLTDYNENWQIQNKIASKYEVKNSGKSYTFYLKENYYWHDGTRLSTKDINYSFKDVKVNKLTDSIIEFILPESFAPFPSLVSQPLFKQGLVGLGEYRVQSIDFEGNFISKLVVTKKGVILKFKFYPLEKDALIGYKLGEIDTLWGITDKNLLQNPNLKFLETPDYRKYVGVFFNTQSGLLSEKNFRQALSYTLEDKNIREKKSFSPISPNSWAYNPEVKKYEYNLETARNLLNKVIGENGNKNIKLKLTAVRPYDKYAEVIADSWKKLGIETQIEIVTFIPARFDALLAAQESPIDPDQYQFWHSIGKNNLTAYDNKRVDLLLEEGRKTIILKERKSLYFDFQKYLLEDSPVIFLYFPKTYTITKL